MDSAVGALRAGAEVPVAGRPSRCAAEESGRGEDGRGTGSMEVVEGRKMISQRGQEVQEGERRVVAIEA
jgi:hypothetical protein